MKPTEIINRVDPPRRGPAPKVSVLLPVHNGSAYIESAMRSMMLQTLRDIEIVTVDDGSTDETPQILDRLKAEDSRIRILRPAKNLRLPRALNFGLDHVRGEYVARMDGDDLSLPGRLARQAAYLDANPKVILVGSGIQEIDSQSRPIRSKPFSADPFAVRWKMRFGMPFNHPTFMFRRAAMTARYDPEWTVSEDYEIITRISDLGQIVCLPELLLKYRIHTESITGTTWNRQIVEAKMLSERIQTRDLPHRIWEKLAVFRKGYFDLEPLSESEIKALFTAVREMHAHDIATSPDHARWLSRETAQVLWATLWRSGRRYGACLRPFLTEGRDFLPALLLYKLENKQRLPKALQSAIDVDAYPSDEV